MIHEALTWPGAPLAGIWPMKINNAVLLINKIQIYYYSTTESWKEGLSPMKIFYGYTDPGKDERIHTLQRSILWVLPAYVLNSVLCDGAKIPKEHPR